LPRNIARELLLTGEPISAERAERLGLVNQLCASGQAENEALTLAETICLNGPVAIRETMRFLRELDVADEPVGWAETVHSEDVIRTAADTLEGVNAFFEKREPRWSGR